MKFNDLFVSRETAKKLKENGFSADTHFWFSQNILTEEWRIVGGFDILPNTALRAPTAEEILNELPKSVEIYLAYGTLWAVRVFEDSPRFRENQHKSLSEAAAQMWLWLKEKGYLKGE